MSAGTKTGTIALLDLPPSTSITLDGSTHAVRRDDFIGISAVPSGGFHLVVVSSAGGEGRTEHDGGTGGGSLSKPSALHTAGFIVHKDGKSEGESWIVARRYDPHTEEVSSVPVDDLTTVNLLRAVGEGSLEPQRVVSYDRFRTTPVEEWTEVTEFVTESLLKKHGVADEDKVVPGCCEPEEGEAEAPKLPSANASKASKTDGTAVSYPPIPCIESTSAASPGQMARKRHAGTRRYLSRLSPSERSALFLDPDPGSRVLTDVLKMYYDGRWEHLVGDVQLSFLLFLHLGCLSSFEHWRDTLSMLSFAGTAVVSSHAELYWNIVRTTTKHLSSIEKDFFEEVEYSGGNFFVPALNRLFLVCSVCKDEKLANALSDLSQIARNRFGLKLSSSPVLTFGEDKGVLKRPHSSRMSTSCDEPSSSEEEEAMEIDMRDGSAIDVSSCKEKVGKCNEDGYQVSSEMLAELADSDEDGPVIVAAEEVVASLARSEEYSRKGNRQSRNEKKYQQSYPLLFAAMSPQEDLVMTCARVLDEASDVSLVREAAAYLEEVEAKRTPDHSQ